MIDVLLVFLFFGGVVTAAIKLAIHVVRQRETEWKKIAQQLGFEIEREHGRLLLCGTYAGLEVEIDNASSGEDGVVRIFRIRSSTDFPFSLATRSAQPFQWNPAGVWFDHPAFERRFRVEGDETRARAAFPERVRSMFVRFMQGTQLVRIHLENNLLEAHVLVRDISEPDILAATERLTRLYKELDVPRPLVHERLLEQLAEGGDARIADRLLHLLLRFHDPVIAERAIHVAISHPDPVIRLMGAFRDREKYQSVLIAAVFDLQLADEVRARAFGALPIGVFDAGALAKLRPTAGVGLHTAIVKRLRELRHEHVEEELIDALSDREEEVRVAAAESLAEVGTVEAVPALQRAGEGLFTTSRMRDAASDAVEAIQARVLAPERGGLSLVDREGAGAVSLATKEGALSLKS